MAPLRPTILAVCVAAALAGAVTEKQAGATYECQSTYGEWFEDWCNTNCNHDPPFCPFPWCDCEVTFAPPSLTEEPGFVQAHYGDPNDCCLDRATIWFTSESGDLYYVPFNAETGSAGEPTLCYEFENAVDIEIDSEGGVFVADFNDAKVFYVEPECGNRYMLWSWHTHQISAPLSIAIADGGLIVATLPADVSFFLLGNDNVTTYRYLDHVHIGSYSRVEDIEVDNINYNSIYHIEGDTIYEGDDVFLSGKARRIPDIQDLYVSPFGCGLFFSAPDLNQVWHCDDVHNGTSCDTFCMNAGIDDVTCENTWNPWGVTGDCGCNFYYTNKAGGGISFIPYGTHNFTEGDTPRSFEIVDGLWHPQDIEIWVPNNCSEAPSPSPSPSPSQMPIYQIFISETKGRCSTDNCVDASPDANVTVRLAWEVRRTYDSSSSEVPVDQEDLINWSKDDFKLYVDLKEPNRTLADLPFFSVEPDVFVFQSPNEFSLEPLIAATVSCVNIEEQGQVFGVAWIVNNQTGPCLYDDDLNDGILYCGADGRGSRNSDGTPNLDVDFRDADGNPPPDNSRFFQSGCPSVTK